MGESVPPGPRGSASKLDALRGAVNASLLGKGHVVDLALVAVLARGHVLVDDIPGVGKTTLGLSLARALGGRFSRLQCTNDLLASDLTGVNVLDARDGSFRFKPGPIFANVLLADELNRASPRTQSALLEAMNEAQVTVDGETRPLPSPFLVIATENPFDHHGTFPLPDSQLDRFLLRLEIGYPNRETEREILRTTRRPRETPDPVLEAGELQELQERVRRVSLHPELEDHLLDLVARTRADPRLLRGASVRAAEGLALATRALALLRGRDYAVPEDLRDLCVPVLAHRVLPRLDGVRARHEAAAEALRGILWDLGAP